MIIALGVPFSAVGAIWLIYLPGFSMSISVWVGIVALLGIHAETRVFMLLHLDLAYEKAKQEKTQLRGLDLVEAVVEGAAKRLRTKFMTFATMCIGLAPILWSMGSGSEILKRIAAPMVGGILTSFVLELVVYPAVYAIWRERECVDFAAIVVSQRWKKTVLHPDSPGTHLRVCARQPVRASTDTRLALLRSMSWRREERNRAIP